MSYDLVFFDLNKAPKTVDEFCDWQDEIDENADYCEHITECPKVLQAFYAEFSQTFPSLEDAGENDFESQNFTRYSYSEFFIEGSFAFSVVEEVGKLALKLVDKHKIGIFDPQDGKMHLPKN